MCASQQTCICSFLIDRPLVAGPSVFPILKGQAVSYGSLVKGMSGWQRQCDHGKCDTRVPLTGRDGHCWQLACQPPLGAWHTDRRSGALLPRRNKLHLLEVKAQNTGDTHRCTHLSRSRGWREFWWEGRDSKLQPVSSLDVLGRKMKKRSDGSGRTCT